MPEQPEVMTVPEAAAFLRISEQTVYQLLRSSELRGVKAGKAWRIHRDALVAYLQGKAQKDTEG